MLTSHDMTTRKFERSALGGYKVDDVDGYINEIARDFDELEERNNVLTKKLEVLAEKLEEYRSDEESLRSALLGAQKLGDSVIRESKNKSEIIMRDATIKADRLVNAARDQVEKEKLIYIKMQKDVATFKNKLLAIYKQHLELISSLPEDPSKERASEQQQPPQEPSAQAAEAAPTPRDERDERDEREAQHAPHAQEEPREQPHRQPPAEEPEQEDEDDYEEPAPKVRKFIPVPHREEMDSPVAEENKKSPYAAEYYEDLDDEEKPEEDLGARKKSRFGTLKFGAGYDLKRE